MTGRNFDSLLIATSNKGKLKEFTELEALGLTLLTLADLGIESPEETGTTFEANAVLKAQHGAAASGLLTIADDSGLVVPALNGEPGVYSARYAGPDGDDAANRARLLQELANRSITQPAAYFHCSLAIALPEGELLVTEGRCDGVIIDQERGSFGFGYDPLFELPDGRTMAELQPSEKRQISHRGAALVKAVPMIAEILNQHAAMELGSS